MTTFKTGNAVGSNDPRDLYDNAENIDEWANSTEKHAHPDRLGVERLTMHGMEQEFASLLASSGYLFVDDEYGPGIELTSYNQVIRADGELWRLSGSAELPYTTTGSGMPESGSFVSVGDAALRQELGSPGGASRISGNTYLVDSVTTLLALPDDQKRADLRYEVKGYHQGSTVGGGAFYWDATRTDENDGGTVLNGFVRAKTHTLSMEAFGCVGDGVTDNAEAITKINAYLSTNPTQMTAGKGVFRTSVIFKPNGGFSGAGQNETVLQWIASGAATGGVVEPHGPGLYCDFTADGDVSEDPATWTAANHDAFAGIGGVYVRADNIVLRNVTGKNARWAGIAGWEVKGVTLENCRAERCRGNFGDGFFFHKNCENIVHVNCRAYDFTRIGFVFDGEADAPSRGASYDNCRAEYGHDRSTLYGGGEFNSGFWVENCTQVTFNDCFSRNTGERGFTVAIGSGSTVPQTPAAIGLMSCIVESLSPQKPSSTIVLGFSVDGLDSPSRGLVDITACSTKGAERGFSATRAVDMHLTGCSYTYSGGGAQSRAVSASIGARVWIKGFHENWSARPSAILDPGADAASVGSFSGDTTSALLMSVDGYFTSDGVPCVIKNGIGSSLVPMKLIVKNTSVALAGPVYALGGIRFEDSRVAVLANSSMRIGRRGSFVNTPIDMAGGRLLVGWGDDVELLTFSGCAITKEGADNFLWIYREDGASSRVPRFMFDGCKFSWDLASHNYIVRQGAEVAVFESPGQSQFYNGCVFVNTGAATSNLPIAIDATSVSVAKAYLSGCWKSSSISSMVKEGYLAADSTVANL